VPRRTLAVVAVALVLALAGCGSTGDSTATPTAEGPGPGGDGGDGGVGAIDSLADLATTGDDAAPESFTITSNTRVTDDDGAVIENRTIRVADGTAFTETRRRVTGTNESVTVTETYTTENATFVRHTVPGAEASTYERLPRSETGLPGVAALAERFEFEHERTDGGHRFTVDSPDQVAEDTFDGEVRNVSVVVIVSEAGVVTELRYDLVLVTDNGVIEYHTDRVVTDRGSTTVSAPDWLAEARQRTPPV
jgi:hypothetical protein